MRTADEMYQYCVDNGYGQGLNRKWGVKHFEIIANALNSDENVDMCFIGLRNYVSMTKHDNNFAYAVTNKRIIMAQQKVIGQTMQTVSLNNLNDITMTTGMLWGIITIDTIKETFNVAVAKEVSQNINDKLHDVLLLRNQGIAPTVSQESMADEILKYKNLLDLGAITQEEFDAKKKKILGI